MLVKPEEGRNQLRFTRRSGRIMAMVGSSKSGGIHLPDESDTGQSITLCRHRGHPGAAPRTHFGKPGVVPEHLGAVRKDWRQLIIRKPVRVDAGTWGMPQTVVTNINRPLRPQLDPRMSPAHIGFRISAD